MSETVYAFDSPRKWHVAHMADRVRRIWYGVAATPRVRRAQWEAVLAVAVDALATVAATADDQWSRDLGQRALADLAAHTDGWAK